VTAGGEALLRRDGFPAIFLFVLVPFGALCVGMAAHPLQILDSEAEIRGRTEAWRVPAEAAARAAEVPADLLLALVATESSGRPRATSGAGAVGLAQLLPSTALGEAARLGIASPESLDLFDPAVNLRLGAAYLRDQLRAFGGDEALALAAYHSGPGTPAAWRRDDPSATGLALLRARGTPRTRAYVERVLRRREWFRPPPSAPAGPR